LPTAAPLSGTSRPLSATHQDVAALKQDVLRFQSQSPAEQEKETLRAVYEDHLPRNRSMEGRPLEPEGVALLSEVRRAKTAQEVLRAMLKPGPGQRAAELAMAWGSAETLRVLLKQSPAESPFAPHSLQATIEVICAAHPELATNVGLRPRLSPAQELLRMTSLLAGPLQNYFSTNQRPRIRQLLEASRQAHTPAEMLARLNELGAGLDDSAREALVWVMAAAGAETLRALEAIPPEQFRLGGGIWEEGRAALRLRLGLPPASRVFGGVDDRTSGQWWRGTASEVQRSLWREQLARENDDRGTFGGYYQCQAFSRMTFHDPDGAVDWMLRLEPSATLHQGWPDISVFAGYFSDFCGTNRDEHLRRMLSARHPSVRAIAAAALATGDSPAALTALREMRDAPDGPGDLARFELARRGDQRAMDRLSGLLRRETHAGTNVLRLPSRFAWPVADETRALLSNSAKASSLPQPEDDFAVWWDTHHQEVKLGDPWLAEEALKQP
ncbi:MAG: hypothetical protein ACYDC1_20885, partial [Limisphaerales bacterium]